MQRWWLCAVGLALVQQQLLVSLGTVHADTEFITVYRITPRNYTGVTNMDTGDALGDVFFGLYELSFPILCAGNHSGPSISCKNIPILDIPGFNVYTEFLLEVDTRYGDYAECNPDPNNGTFYCTHFHWGERKCWYDDPTWKQDFASLCDPAVCDCYAVETLAVGKELLPFMASFDPSYPEQCAENFGRRENTTFSGPVLNTTTVGMEGDCCSACSALSACMGYVFTPSSPGAASGSCALYANTTHSFPSRQPNSAARKEPNDLLLTQVGVLASILNGTWYSTQAEGQCKEGQKVGVDCWWRLAEQKRNINSTCVNDNVVAKVRAKRPECWDACPQPDNSTSPCFITCLFDTLSGNPYKGIPPMTSAEIVEPFVLSFEKSDPEEGGCPTVPPCPPPCKPPALPGARNVVGFDPERARE